MRVYRETCAIRTQAGRVKHKQEAWFCAPAIPKNSYCFAQHLKSNIMEMYGFRTRAGRVKHTQAALFRAPVILRNSYSLVQHLKSHNSDKSKTIENHVRERYEALLKSETGSQ